MMEFISTIYRGREIQLHWQPHPERIGEYMEQGFIPIELAEGQMSYVDSRCLDHHNEWSHLPSACVTALRYYGCLDTETTAKFMVNHTDADCVLTGVTLMGFLPQSVLQKLNHEVGLLDVDPLGTDILQLSCGRSILLWKTSMASVRKSGWSWLYGMQLFVDLFCNVVYYEKAIAKLDEKERDRKRVATEDYAGARCSPSGKVLLVTPSRVRGFDVQLGRQLEFPADSPRGWRHWCVVSYVEKSGNVTLSCPNTQVAERVFGSGGLMRVYPKLPSLEGKSWGGRESVGGSPRGIPFPGSLLDVVLETIENNRVEG